MIIILPRGYEVDPMELPADFETEIAEVFRAYTKGTSKEYTFQDKLAFIDLCIERAHDYDDSCEAVKKFLSGRMVSEVEDGEFPQEDDYYCFDFMVECFDMGKEYQSAYSHNYGNNRHINEAVEKMLLKIMKVIVDWQE